MLNLAMKSKLSSEEVLKRAADFFGPSDYGLKRADYIAAFFRNTNWEAVEARLK